MRKIVVSGAVAGLVLSVFAAAGTAQAATTTTKTIKSGSSTIVTTTTTYVSPVSCAPARKMSKAKK